MAARSSPEQAEAAWQALDRELGRWPASDALFWWRDDDAVAATPALDRLLILRARLSIPLALAVIPAGAAHSVMDRLQSEPPVRVLQHGWNHVDHARAGRPRAELPAGREPAQVAAELLTGRERLAALFGERFLPVLVPPFNFVAPDLMPSVRAAGLAFLSIDGDFADGTLPDCNVHIDPIDWSSGTAVGTSAMVRQAIVALRLRRFGLVDRRSPVGVMTHHLQHDEPIWASVTRLLETLAAHSAVRFPPIEALFAT